MANSYGGSRSGIGCGGVVGLGLLAVISANSVASFVLDYHWWQEMGQLEVFWKQFQYRLVPSFLAFLLLFAVAWIAHARAMKHAGTGLRDYPRYAWIATLVLLLLAFLVASSVVDSWAIVRYFGAEGGGAPGQPDPVFGKPLAFYLFSLPFYRNLLAVLLATATLGGLTYWLASRIWDVRTRLAHRFDRGGPLDIRELRLEASFEALFLRIMGAIFLAVLAVRLYFARYNLLFEDHGTFVGVDWIAENLSLPLQWVAIAAALLGAVLLLARRGKWALFLLLVIPVRSFLPPLVNSFYVRPNEIAIQKPYIQRHIEQTRAAYGLDRRARAIEYPALREARIDVERNRALLENLRLWDWRPFRDAVTQVQPFRPFTYADIDVDRYSIGGQIRQVLVAPRELALAQVGEAGQRWINKHFTYTHGYGVVVAEANQITPAGLPVLFVQDAPPEIKTPDLKLTRPEIYYGEQSHSPVFVRTRQPEFSYSTGSQDVSSNYAGKGGFPIGTWWLRLMAAISEGDYNILLTNNLTAESRMMLRRQVDERLEALAGFITWDPDPYLVLAADGRMVWIVDGYLTSSAHPYARSVSSDVFGEVNYVRNSVKATVDAYDGTVRIYVFDPEDPLVAAYRSLFPSLFSDADAMPADLRAHARVPEALFRVQAEIYRTYHMRDPESFYNRADLWDLPSVAGASAAVAPSGLPERFAERLARFEASGRYAPTYILARLPGETAPEFLLTMPFVPHNKQNLIGMMAARCDGDQLGELVYINVGRQEILPGPNQVEANISQDQNISKDLTLWNQQGSQVLRGQLLILPLDGTFLYVAPIYIQAKEAKMPQLKKIALVNGNTIVYRDTFGEALAELKALGGEGTRPSPAKPAGETRREISGPATGDDARLRQIRDSFLRYKALMVQGKWAEAGRELEALEELLKR
jgi:uncharacterized membrane protein (UPF0182 family)